MRSPHRLFCKQGDWKYAFTEERPGFLFRRTMRRIRRVPDRTNLAGRSETAGTWSVAWTRLHETRRGPQSAHKSLMIKEKNLVEAVGIEPTSEKVQRSKTTCVACSEVSTVSLERARRRRPSLIDLDLPPQTAGFSPVHSMTLDR